MNKARTKYRHVGFPMPINVIDLNLSILIGEFGVFYCYKSGEL